MVCSFQPLALGRLGAADWLGVVERYWQFETYYLPLAMCAGGADGIDGTGGGSSGASKGPAGLTAGKKDCWRAYPTAPVHVKDRIGPGPCGDGPRFWTDVPTSSDVRQASST